MIGIGRTYRRILSELIEGGAFQLSYPLATHGHFVGYLRPR
jgi:hypothetical protein